MADPLTVDRFIELAILAATAVAAFAATRAARDAARISAHALEDGQADARRRATFEHLREIDARALNAWRSGVKRELLLEETRNHAPLSQSSADLMGLLNVLDVFAYAVRNRLVDPELANGYMKTLVRSTDWLLPLIHEFRGCCSDPDAYDELEQYVQRLLRDFPALQPPEQEAHS